jgi:hypothetical protein
MRLSSVRQTGPDTTEPDFTDHTPCRRPDNATNWLTAVESAHYAAGAVQPDAARALCAELDYRHELLWNELRAELGDIIVQHAIVDDTARFIDRTQRNDIRHWIAAVVAHDADAVGSTNVVDVVDQS